MAVHSDGGGGGRPPQVVSVHDRGGWLLLETRSACTTLMAGSLVVSLPLAKWIALLSSSCWARWTQWWGKSKPRLVLARRGTV